jgi:hypothetical protein
MEMPAVSPAYGMILEGSRQAAPNPAALQQIFFETSPNHKYCILFFTANRPLATILNMDSFAGKHPHRYC